MCNEIKEIDKLKNIVEKLTELQYWLSGFLMRDELDDYQAMLLAREHYDAICEAKWRINILFHIEKQKQDNKN